MRWGREGGGGREGRGEGICTLFMDVCMRTQSLLLC